MRIYSEKYFPGDKREYFRARYLFLLLFCSVLNINAQLSDLSGAKLCKSETNPLALCELKFSVPVLNAAGRICKTGRYELRSVNRIQANQDYHSSEDSHAIIPFFCFVSGNQSELTGKDKNKISGCFSDLDTAFN